MQAESFTHLQPMLQWRYAVRRFSDEIVSDAKLNQILKDTRLSPSSFGLQPYKLLVITDNEIKNKLVEASYGQEKIAQNSHLLILSADMSSITTMVEQYILRYSLHTDLIGKKLSAMKQTMLSAVSGFDVQQQYQWASEQAYIALSTLLLSAASLKVDACPVGGIDKAKYDQILKLDQAKLKTVIACPIGYRHPLDYVAHVNKVRKPIEDLVIKVE
ncbi:NAD(P)H-dependent oxidoreductase [Pseudoalteromonas sp. JBTF-M23]|uniref:NAD(P)H-dependent oxidoreductase n=1 Tax=Pseudoalteromonas caenipelagi TaxID=2726988 RepID=A0A849VBH8_9GAMM|nr:NAD(P)H-dependent oxidoreductase [Pseudoalteromonas caenipelagi]NOU50365.1 NAD(P)H-dependent oxidoreductase [Pseudoalteromonas caenipelagi]